jgi:hypothetical protein
MKVNLNRQLLGLEDLLFGTGEVIQTRGGQEVSVTRINAANLPFDELNSLRDVLESQDNINAIADNLVGLNTIYDNMGSLGTIVNNMESVVIVALADGKINDLMSNLPDILAVSGNLSAITSVVVLEGVMNTIAGISTEIPQVASIAGQVAEVSNISEDIQVLAPKAADLVNLSDNINTIQSVLDNMDEVENVGASIGAIELIGYDLANSCLIAIEDLGSVADPITVGECGTSHIVNVANSLPEISNISGAIAQVIICGDNISSIISVASAISGVNTLAPYAADIAVLSPYAADIGTVSSSIGDVVSVSNNLSHVVNVATQVVPNLTEILQADDNAATATLMANSATQSEANAANSETMAYRWASAAEDFEVVPGQYSAKHWAIKSAQIVTDGVIDDSSPSLVKTYSSVQIESRLDTKADISLLSSSVVLYPTTVVGDFGYYKLVSEVTDPDFNDTAVNLSTGVLSGSDVLLASLIADESLINGNTGVINVSTIGNIRRVSGNSQGLFYFNIYKRDAAGTETLIGTGSDTLLVETSDYTQFSSNVLIQITDFIATDRVVIKYYGTDYGGGADSTYEFQIGGDSPVRTLLPLPISVTVNPNTVITTNTPAEGDMLVYTSNSWVATNTFDFGGI